MADARNTESNVFLDHPGVVATLFAIAVLGVFMFAIYATAIDAHREHESEHAAGAASGAPSAHAASGAPSAQAAPAPSH